MIRQRSEDFATASFGGRGGISTDKRLRYELEGGFAGVRPPSPNPNVATISRSNRVCSELESALASFCMDGPMGMGYGTGDQQQGHEPMPELFNYVCPAPHYSGGPHPGMGAASPLPRPTARLVLLEISAVCDQVWRAGTCAEGPHSYSTTKRSYPFDDSRYHPNDLLLPVAGGGPKGAPPSPGRPWMLPPVGGHDHAGSSPHHGHGGGFASSSQQEDEMRPLGEGLSPYEEAPRLTMQPLTSHLLLTLGGFERTTCGGFIHLKHVVRPSADVIVPQEILDAERFVRPQTVTNAMNPIQPNGFTTMCALYAACQRLLRERGYPPYAAPSGVPLTVFLGNADGFGWREDLNRVPDCQRVVCDAAVKTLQGGSDACFLLCDAMLTDAGLPMIERELHTVIGGANMYHAFTSHFSYGAGIAALCAQSVAGHSSSPPPHGIGGSGAHPPLVSPPHVLVRARIAHGCVLVTMPAGLDGPIVAFFYINRAVCDGPSCTAEAGGALGIGMGTPYAATPSSLMAPASSSLSFADVVESNAEKAMRYLWWYVHQTALAYFPVERVHIVCSIGEVFSREQVDHLPTQRKEMPRLSAIQAMCCEGDYGFVSGGVGDPSATKRCRYVCCGAPPTSSSAFVTRQSLVYFQDL